MTNPPSSGLGCAYGVVVALGLVATVVAGGVGLWLGGRSAPPPAAAPVAASVPPTAAPPTPAEPQPAVATVARDSAAVEALVRASEGDRADEVLVEIDADWAFVDSVSLDETGQASAALSLLFHKDAAGWREVARGDAMDFPQHLPADRVPAFERWHAGHF